MKADSAKLISSITITDSNYTIAMDLLIERYENKRSVVQAHFQKIWGQPNMRSESATGLRKILETTNEHLRALRELRQPVSYWDALLVFWLSDKMDQESRKQWQLAHSGTDIKTWDDLSKFLDNRTRALETGSLKEGPPENAKAQFSEKREQFYHMSAVCRNMW